LGQGCTRVVGGEVYAVAAVDLPVDEPGNNVRDIIAISTGSSSRTIAEDDERVRAKGVGKIRLMKIK
jgi:hypothetical protein